MSKLINTTFDFNNAGGIINLPDPVTAQAAATKAYVDTSVTGLAWKTDVLVAPTTNINLSSPGSTLDGVSMSNGNRFLAFNQSTASQNGIYIYNGSSSAATRSSDAATAAELYNAVVSVEQGTNAGVTYRQTVTSGVTLGSTSLTFTTFGTAAPSATTSTAGVAALATQGEVNTGSVTNKIVTPATLAGYTGLLHKVTAAVGDGSATSYAINHNLATYDVIVTVHKQSGNYDDVVCDIQRTSTNQVTLIFATAPTSNAYNVVIIG